GDDWTRKDAFNVEGKPAENTRIADLAHSWYAIEDEHLRLMLQSLLFDRFRLKVHRETRSVTAYTLARNGKTLRLRPAEVPADRRPSTSFSSVGYAGGRWGIT